LNFSTALGRLRTIGFIEGVSAWLLFFVAMPWKHLVDPELTLRDSAHVPVGQHVVHYVGMAHGILWSVYMLAVLNTWIARRWGIGRAVVAGLASIPPFGTFLFDRSLRREQRAGGESDARDGRQSRDR